MRRLVCTISAVFLFVACADSPTDLQDDVAGPQFGMAVTDGPISFIGTTSFDAFMPRSGEWFLKDFLCTAEAVLVFGEGHDVVLTTTETCFPEPRVLVWEGTLTPGGAVKFRAPAGTGEEVAAHTGCTLSGTFPTYHGHFDGEYLSAGGHFHGLCDGGDTWNDPTFPSNFPFPDEPVPVNVYFGFELTVVP